MTAHRDLLLSVEGLTLSARGPAGWTRVVDGVDFGVCAGETLAIVGESGSGKSLSALSVMGLLPARGVRRDAGRIRLAGQQVHELDEKALNRLRGTKMGMIFQEPMTSLNPVLTVGFQIAETIRTHEHASASDARARALEMLDLVRIPDARRRLDAYPHELSGGMRQRVMIAMALALKPMLLIADEPTTALDVTIQAQILALIDELKRDLRTAVVLITHDLGVVAQMADHIVVFRSGRKVEENDVFSLFAKPAHPYTRALLAASPRHSSGSWRTSRLNEMIPADDAPGADRKGLS